MIDGCSASGPLTTDLRALRGLLDALPAEMGPDREAPIDRLSRAFRLVDAEVHVQERGLRYPVENLAAL
jgi:hypothetical protein